VNQNVHTCGLVHHSVLVSVRLHVQAMTHHQTYFIQNIIQATSLLDLVLREELNCILIMPPGDKGGGELDHLRI
jgi:hypothetical protein